jgi:uncharacterized protein (DUF1501 family)
MSYTISRRRFLVGCSTAIAAMAGARLTNLAFGDPTAAATDSDMLVVVFLRGGWDGLNVIPPIDGPDRGAYESARPNLKIPVSGDNSALKLNAQFGMHPAMAPLFELYQSKKLAVVHACGLKHDTRSHFDAMQFMELGTPGVKSTNGGWLTRHLQSISGQGSGLVIPALSAGSQQAMSLLGYDDAVAMSSPKDFRLWGNGRYINDQRRVLRDMYSSDTWLDRAGTETLDILDVIEAAKPGDYTPSGGATYPENSFGNNLKAIAQLIKMQLGLRVATVDLGGWDTHEYQGDGGTGYLADNQLKPLAQGLAAFYADLGGCGTGGYAGRTTIVVMSEFGRRLKENANHGTDHGHGSVMMVLGGNVNGGKIYGAWPGLASANLYEGYDLQISTDYRQVLGDILTRRMGNANIESVFPGYTGYTPLDIVQTGSAAPPPATPTPNPALNKRTYLPITRGGAQSC